MNTEKRVIFKAKKKAEDEDDLAKQCLEISPDVEMKEIPYTGEEYLLKVINERQNCAEYTVCDKDISQYAKNQSRFYKEPPRTKTAPDKLKITIEWQKVQISDFSDVRSYLTDLLVKKNTWSSKVQTVEIDDDTLVGWKVFFQDNDPTLTCILGLTPASLQRGLEMLVEILKEVQPGCSVDYKIGQWIYAVLARLWQPLLSDTICILRNLARTCADIRSNINQEDENATLLAAPLNLFICIVARYFEQFDLAD